MLKTNTAQIRPAFLRRASWTSREGGIRAVATDLLMFSRGPPPELRVVSRWMLTAVSQYCRKRRYRVVSSPVPTFKLRFEALFYLTYESIDGNPIVHCPFDNTH